MCKQRIQYTSALSFDSVLLFVISVAFMSAHVILTRLIVPYFAVMSTEVRIGHSKFYQHFD